MFQFSFKAVCAGFQSNVVGQTVPGFWCYMRKTLSPNFSLDRGVNSSASVADRRVIERGQAVIGYSKDVM